YIPPACGIMAESSPYESAPAMVSAPAIAHATSNHPGLPISRAISDETMKIPEPIITPITSMVESNKPRPRANSWAVCDESIPGSIPADFCGSEIAMLLGFILTRWILYTYHGVFANLFWCHCD